MRLGAIQLSAMLAALLLATGLVVRISATLSPVAPETRDDTAAKKAIELRDGAYGVALFDGIQLAPGQPHDRCITVRATGTRTPERVVMEATSSIDPALAPWLDLEISRGQAIGDGRSCEGWTGGETILQGGAEQVLAALERGVDWQPTPSQAIPGGHGVTYRLRAMLLPETPNAIQGAATEFDLVWSAPFDPAGSGLLGRSLALALRFTEDSMVPMLAILALAILFLGIQDRLDTATPRLSEAALFDDIVEFRERADTRDG